MTTSRRFDAIAWLLLWGVGLLPLYHQPQALLSFDPQRAGIIGLLAVVTLFVLLGGGWRRLRPISWLLVGWGGWMVLSALFSLNLTTGLIGDSIRRMGALPQAALLAGALASALVVHRYGAQALARVAWWSGLLVSIVAMLQQARWLPTISPTYYPLRSSSTIGYPTFLGTWLVVTVLLCIVFAPRPASRRARWGWWLGVAFIASALVPAGARAATLALAAGVFTLLLVGAVQYGRARALRFLRSALRRRIVLIGFIVLILIALMMPFAIYRFRLPLFQRLNLANEGNATQDYRVLMWTDGLDIARQWPTLTSLNGTPDPLAELRAWVGYGPESQEQVYRLYPPLAHYTVDRAHTLWLDQLITGGWLGLLVRLAATLTLGGYALRRLGLLEPLVLAPLVIAAVAAAIVVRASPWLPLVVTFAAIGGLWLGLVLRLFLRPALPETPLDRPALLALAALVAYLLDNQLGFETLAAAFAFWVTLGPLFARPTPGEPTPLPGEVVAGMMAFSLGLLARGLVFSAPNLNARFFGLILVGLVVASGAVYIHRLGGGQFQRRAVALTLAATLLTTAAAWQIVYVKLGPLAALWDVALVAVGPALLYFISPRLANAEPAQRRFSPRAALAGVLTCVLTALWWADLSGAIALRNAEQPTTENPLAEYGTAALLRPWDARTLSLFSEQALRYVANVGDEAPARLLDWTNEAAYRAAALQPFDSVITLRLARLETIFAQLGEQTDQHSDRAEQLFDAVLSQFPYSPDAYVSRSYFYWMVLRQRERALENVDRALSLDPTSEEAIRLRNVITGA